MCWAKLSTGKISLILSYQGSNDPVRWFSDFAAHLTAWGIKRSIQNAWVPPPESPAAAWASGCLKPRTRFRHAHIWALLMLLGISLPLCGHSGALPLFCCNAVLYFHCRTVFYPLWEKNGGGTFWPHKTRNERSHFLDYNGLAPKGPVCI